ncbi:MAG: hypothetical protein Sapg2KO_49120 [Saprospiraceae bacterium]
MISNGESWWWSIGVLFGIFCVYNWTIILYKGSRSIVLIVKEHTLYTTYERSKVVDKKMEEIKKLDFYSNVFTISDIQRFWRFTFKLNGANTTDMLYLQYQDEKVDWIDLNKYDVKLTDTHLEELVRFLLEHHPSIELGEP